MGLEGVVRLASVLVVRLGAGNDFVLQFAGAVGGTEGVVADAGHVGAVASSALLEQNLAALHGSTVRVRGVASTNNGVLILKNRQSITILFSNQNSTYTSMVRMYMFSDLPKLAPVDISTCKVVAKPFLMLTDHSGSAGSTSKPLTYTQRKQ